ncbi:hypothetical protein [Streptomyces sp. NPDC047097]|uniref:hypothetical protein n=1 Tax=Streptomyces sp. NPDC047097 TaxID=3155260 RepID=UPI0033F9FAAA
MSAAPEHHDPRPEADGAPAGRRARGRGGGGTGLGPAIARETTTGHGGSLTVADDRDGLGGARLLVRLPASP